MTWLLTSKNIPLRYPRPAKLNFSETCTRLGSKSYFKSCSIIEAFWLVCPVHESKMNIFSHGSGRVIVVVVSLCLLINIYTCKASSSSDCSTSCGGHNISHPFRLKQDPHHCGDKRYELSCEQNQLFLYFQSGKYNVLDIDYTNLTIRLRDANIKEFNHSSLPLFSLSNYNLSKVKEYSTTTTDGQELSGPMIYVSCKHQLHSSVYIDTAPCNITSTRGFSYVHVSNASSMTVHESRLKGDCRIELMFMYATSWSSSANKKNNLSCTDIHNLLLYGFELSWSNFNYAYCRTVVANTGLGLLVLLPRCRIRTWDILVRYIEAYSFLVGESIVLYGTVIRVVGTPIVIMFLIYKWRRRHLSMYHNIEDFLQSNNNIMPIRYSYKDIKKLTQGFKIKLGKGGYGSVFRGQLRSDRIVAVKLLDKAKADGQEFINEVATLGRIRHVNVVQLIGYCVEGSKHALIYEFMENGSLEKYIHSQQDNSSLNIEKLYAISLGIARGIEYLHNGCNMKILHFDIKPHNILLDENFNPKVSDFGLAKLYSTDDSIVSLTAVRGTIGYMAPELFYKNVGGVSDKADVYSFGMLLMEMASRRKNLNTLEDHSSQHYLPFWVYDQLNQGKEINIANATEEEMKLAKKMMIVALWCIQTRPSDRPSMNQVVVMLEGEDEDLQIPHEPCLYSQDVAESELENSVSQLSGDPSFLSSQEDDLSV